MSNEVGEQKELFSFCSFFYFISNDSPCQIMIRNLK
ncbi:hypothetical protein EfmE1679_0245, partial [Enterococcus faecium E1679]